MWRSLINKRWSSVSDQSRLQVRLGLKNWPSIQPNCEEAVRQGIEKAYLESWSEGALRPFEAAPERPKSCQPCRPQHQLTLMRTPRFYTTTHHRAAPEQLKSCQACRPHHQLTLEHIPVFYTTHHQPAPEQNKSCQPCLAHHHVADDLLSTAAKLKYQHSYRHVTLSPCALSLQNKQVFDGRSSV